MPATTAPGTGPGGFLARLPVPGRDAVLAAAVRRSWDPGELLVRDGEDATALLVVTQGHAVVRLLLPSGSQVTLAVLGAGDIVGEVGLLNRDHERTADVIALDAVEALVLRRPAFDRIRRSTPEVDDFVMQLMARRIDRLSHRVAEAHHLPAPRRVARRLHEVGRLYGTDEVSVRVPLTQEDLAGLAGAARPTVNAALRRLEQDGVVRLGRGGVEILDQRELRRRC
ncbi:cAMP-binding domain of CRP or a regulatory subunit of cAMP-dependent protein kinases [Microlunatus sagamiharensis]|uniref:cAMP-binding domain of CRP or a regulatory subunit of cAMP-dependent protein kinases n=1 Tax=Microlunatus sagamiharensis TaxID=546874 RepID=A0A1H2MFU4_9ACTN|nr:Crp/Fnr family transcriptional regulator [Microlunatus sagamiharensis]SDU91992.1 cAMP-binding domain of CRP or a regulatory subunit of cAMP-dependent protein kinases [Microlunatus sagamiharensis]